MIEKDNSIKETFALKESQLHAGLIVFLTYSLAQYLTPEQIASIADSLRKTRCRNASQQIEELGILPVSTSREIRHMQLPVKQIRRDELAYVIYKLAPYAVMTRKEAAVFSKLLFPEFFGSVATINTLFTRLEGVPDGLSNIKIYEVPRHTTVGVEEMLTNLASGNL